MQEIDFYLVDAFSNVSFGGNPAAVCPLKAWLPDETLLKMAQQHNQSETAFFVCTKGGIELRWFTTLTEVNLCGHATLAAAYVLFNELDYPDSRIHFETASGRLTVSREGEWLTLDFPACPTHEETPRRRCSRRSVSAATLKPAKAAHGWWCWKIASRLKHSHRQFQP